MANPDGRSVQYHLNRLAGTLNASGVPTLAEAAAANAYAGTTNRETVAALNVKAGITDPSKFLDRQGVLNKLAGTTGLGEAEAAARIA